MITLVWSSEWPIWDPASQVPPLAKQKKKVNFYSATQISLISCQEITEILWLLAGILKLMNLSVKFHATLQQICCSE